MPHLVSGPSELAARFTATIEAIQATAAPILAEVYSVVDPVHAQDIVCTLIERDPDLVYRFRQASGPGNPLNEPVLLITDALATLKGVDPDLFMDDLGVKYAARLFKAVTGMIDHLSALAHVRSAGPAERRRQNYAHRARLRAEGKEVPTAPSAYEPDGPAVYPHGKPVFAPGVVDGLGRPAK